MMTRLTILAGLLCGTLAYAAPISNVEALTVSPLVEWEARTEHPEASDATVASRRRPVPPRRPPVAVAESSPAGVQAPRRAILTCGDWEPMVGMPAGARRTRSPGLVQRCTFL